MVLKNESKARALEFGYQDEDGIDMQAGTTILELNIIPIVMVII